MILLDYVTKNVTFYRGVGHVIFNLHLGLGHLGLCQMEGVGHAFCNHYIFKCSTDASCGITFQRTCKQLRMGTSLGSAY